jgi:NAD(P)H dehydrogenase (quinone)
MYSTDRVSPEDFDDAAKAREQRLLSLEETDPIPFRTPCRA